MTDSPLPDAQLPLSHGGLITRAAAGPHNDTAQPPLTSGFGAVMEKEHELQSATQRHLGEVRGPHSAEIERILRQHHVQLGANLALLEQRYEMLPHPGRFQAMHGMPGPLSKARPAGPPESIDMLANLIGLHVRLLGDIDALIRRAPDGQRGELILTEVGHNHENMAWMLTALLKEDESVRDRAAPPEGASKPAVPAPAEGRWENEGGAVRAPHLPRPARITA